MTSEVSPVVTIDRSGGPMPQQDVTITQGWNYDPANLENLVSSTDGNGNTTTYTYDVYGHRTGQTQPDPDGSGTLAAPVTEYAYDADGNLVSTTLATASPQQTVKTVYDRMGRVTKTVNPDGTYTTAEYDTAGNLVYQTDAMGRVTRFVYDARNRLIATVYPDGSTSQTAYDGGGRVVASTDGRGNTTRYVYDKLGRKTEEIAPYANASQAATLDDSSASPAFTTTGTWTTTSGSGGYKGGYSSAAGSASATWTFSQTQNVIAGRYYEVLVTWAAASTDTDNAQFTVWDGAIGGGYNRGTVSVNQQFAPLPNATFTDAWWSSLGLFYVSSGTLTVNLTNGDSNYNLIADAVKIVEVTPTFYGYDAQGNLQYTTVGAKPGDASHSTYLTHDVLGRTTATVAPYADPSKKMTLDDSDGTAPSSSPAAPGPPLRQRRLQRRL